MSDSENKEEKRPEIPFSGVVYGDTIYWGTIGSAVVALIGQMVAFLGGSNVIPPGTLFSMIWEGSKYDTIWKQTVGSRPEGHWYFSQLATGDGLTMFGIALGVFIVIPAILASAWVLLRVEKRPFFATLAVIAALITIASFLGLLPLPIGG